MKQQISPTKVFRSRRDRYLFSLLALGVGCANPTPSTLNQKCFHHEDCDAGQYCERTEGAPDGLCRTGEPPPDGTTTGTTGSTSASSTSTAPTSSTVSSAATGPTTPDPTSGEVGTDDATADTGGSDTTDTGDGVAPTLLSVTPADGELGVLEDAEIVFEFSEAMDPTATQAAFDSPDIEPDEAAFNWNGAGDTLTVVPGALLPYAAGGAGVVALEFEFSLSTAAQDVSGEPLNAAVNVSFSTARHITMEFVPEAVDSGYVVGDGFIHTDNDFLVGDSPSDDWFRSLLSFDIVALPSAVVAWNSATLTIEQADDTFGAPYSTLGDVHVHDEGYAAVTLGAASSVGPDLGEFSADGVPGPKSADVTDAVEADYLGGVTQFMLKFQSDTDSDGALDSVRFRDDNASLIVDLLAE